MANLVTLVDFDSNPTYGANPYGGITYGNGLIGTTAAGGTYGNGTLFLIESFSEYFSDVQIDTLVSFDGTDGADPRGSLITDAAGDLFGITYGGGTNGDGTVFEIAWNGRSGYAGTPTTLVSFASPSFQSNQPASVGLVMDSAGDLFGTTETGGIYGDGTVFEIAKTANGYASTPTTLLNFNGANGRDPIGTLMLDSSGNLIGTTSDGGPNNLGTVFELAKTANGYASTATTISLGSNPIPVAGLIADAKGDLFGTSFQGGPDGDGTVFEIAKTADGYASAPITLATFNGADGAQPSGPLIMDAVGNLFGITALGGPDVTGGTVFEIAKTVDGYASAPTTLGSFSNSPFSAGANPYESLSADAEGNLYGVTTEETTNGNGTVFEVTSSGFVPLTVSISGVALDGQTLTATANGDVASYQWRDLINGTWTNINGATNATYQVQDSDTGYLIDVVVTGNDGLTATNAGQGLLVVIPPTVTISGTAQEGQTLSAEVLGEAAAYEWQELVDGIWTNINGASSATYQIQANDVGRQIRVQIVNSFNISATSAATNSVVDLVSGELHEEACRRRDTLARASATPLAWTSKRVCRRGSATVRRSRASRPGYRARACIASTPAARRSC